jgi:hypothetical protein
VRLVWATGNFSIALVWAAQGRQEEVVRGYRGVVELRVESIGGRWPAGGESSPRARAAHAATMGAATTCCLHMRKEVGF